MALNSQPRLQLTIITIAVATRTMAEESKFILKNTSRRAFYDFGSCYRLFLAQEHSNLQFEISAEELKKYNFEIDTVCPSLVYGHMFDLNLNKKYIGTHTHTRGFNCLD